MNKEKRAIIPAHLVYILLSVLVIVVYFLIDGSGIVLTTKSFAEGSISADYVSVNTGKFSTMLEQYIYRVIYLAITLFPIVFVSLKFHISFYKGNDSSSLKRLIPYIRVLFGLLAFYYAITVGTVFGHECFTNYFSLGIWYSFFRIITAFILLGAFVLDWPKFIQEIKKLPSSHPTLYKSIFVVFISILSCLILEYQVGSKMEMISSMVIFNISYWLILQVFIDVLTRNVKIGAIVSLVFAYLIGLINDVVYQFRGNYVMFGDLTVIRTAIEVAGNYTYKPGVWFWIALLLLITSIALTVLLRLPKRMKPTMKEIAVRIGIGIVIVIGVAFTFSNGFLYKNVFGVGWNYNDNVKYTGYIPYFLSNMNSIQKVELEVYDAAVADEALSMTGASEDQAHSYPNIIIIQNEAFADMSVLYDIETNQDYMPFIRSLTENTRKGYLNMSITGGPTANTEFEILMRSTLGFLPYGSVPYTQYVDADLPSIAQVLSNQPVPYYTVAYHPYYSAGYRRTEVYNHFGFDEIIFEDNFREDFPQDDIIRDYLSDSADYRRVEEFYENFRSTSDAPWFCFNVTIQNHGGYTQEFEPSEENRVYVTNFEATDSFNDYLSLIRMSDRAFEELVGYFENCDEPTIIAMYGDHQPSMDDEAMAVLEEHYADGENGQFDNYYVPYVIWANFDIEEEDNISDGVLNTLSTNYFASTVFDIAGVELTDYDRYLLAMHEQVPAITAIGVWDNEGNYYSSADSSPYDELSNLQMIQYNLIFDDDGRLTDRFE